MNLTDSRNAIAEYDALAKIRFALEEFSTGDISELNLTFRIASGATKQVTVPVDTIDDVKTAIATKVTALETEMTTIESLFT